MPRFPSRAVRTTPGHPPSSVTISGESSSTTASATASAQAWSPLDSAQLLPVSRAAAGFVTQVTVRNSANASRGRDDESEEPRGAAHHLLMFEVLGHLASQLYLNLS